jgi:hypothetical protein
MCADFQFSLLPITKQKQKISNSYKSDSELMKKKEEYSTNSTTTYRFITICEYFHADPLTTCI